MPIAARGSLFRLAERTEDDDLDVEKLMLVGLLNGMGGYAVSRALVMVPNGLSVSSGGRRVAQCRAGIPKIPGLRGSAMYVGSSFYCNDDDPNGR